jgi:NAD(P)-dependent dehydrogenase (short-subunit alcohol dehydrogenase family)
MTTTTLEGSTALVTGATAGIGRAVALQLGQLGAEVSRTKSGHWPAVCIGSSDGQHANMLCLEELLTFGVGEGLHPALNVLAGYSRATWMK